MPIKVTCSCGSSFSAKDEIAGRTVACPKCRQPIQVPAVATGSPAGRVQSTEASKPTAAPKPAAAAPKPAVAKPVAAKPAGPAPPVPPIGAPSNDLFDEVGLKAVAGPRCPQCSTPLNPNAVLCVTCGFNIQTGEKLTEAKVQSRGEGGHAAVSDSLLKRAVERIEDERQEEKKQRAQGAPTYVYFFAFAAVIAFAATMLTLPRDQAFRVCGTGICVFGYLMMTYYGIRMIIAAFYESTTCGLLFLFIPLYQLYYLITRWQRMSSFFLMQLMGLGVAMLGIGMIVVAPFMAIKEDGESAYVAPSAIETQIRA
jgi:uncharacterized Zn finger protein (UPF0148 family)